MLAFLYHTKLGRCILKILTRPEVSYVCGKFMDSPLSRPIIPFFIKKNKINMNDYMQEHYTCFNDFFCRQIKASKRPINMEEDVLIAPCDGLLSAYKIKQDLVIPVKGSNYSITDLLRDKSLAAKYSNGYCLVFRLCVNHYHRYCYPDNGTKSKNYFLPGILHTVRPIALRKVPVFTENAREYTILNTEHFGKLVQMEVGAMLVGKIQNYHPEFTFKRGDEKGRFLYGGSTIILLVEPNRIKLPKNLLDATANNKECNVQMGQRIGRKL